MEWEFNPGLGLYLAKNTRRHCHSTITGIDAHRQSAFLTEKQRLRRAIFLLAYAKRTTQNRGDYVPIATGIVSFSEKDKGSSNRISVANADVDGCEQENASSCHTRQQIALCSFLAWTSQAAAWLKAYRSRRGGSGTRDAKAFSISAVVYPRVDYAGNGCAQPQAVQAQPSKPRGF